MHTNYYGREGLCEPLPADGRLPFVVGLPLPLGDPPGLPVGRLPAAPFPAGFLLSPKGRLSLPLEPAGFLASSLGCLVFPFAAPIGLDGALGFEDIFGFEEPSVRVFFRGALRDFFAGALASEDESSIDFSNTDNSLGVKSRHSPTGMPFRLTFIIRVRSNLTTS